LRRDRTGNVMGEALLNEGQKGVLIVHRVFSWQMTG
jgi:hypothetical protein